MMPGQLQLPMRTCTLTIPKKKTKKKHSLRDSYQGYKGLLTDCGRFFVLEPLSFQMLAVLNLLD